MSREGARWAWKTLTSPPARKLILVCLADHANTSGECTLTISEIMRLTGISRRVVINHLNGLMDDGLVKRQAHFRRDGSQTANVYYLPFGNPFKYIRDLEAASVDKWEVAKGDF